MVNHIWLYSFLYFNFIIKICRFNQHSVMVLKACNKHVVDQSENSPKQVNGETNNEITQKSKKVRNLIIFANIGRF